jgi:hypothetical protein
MMMLATQKDRLIAADVARGTTRFLARADCMALPEVSLGNGRRTDLMGLCPKGLITIVEIKVSRADLLGDAKWLEYLDYCDRFFWAIPAGFDMTLLERPATLPERTGLIVADRYDAAMIRNAIETPLPSSRRRAETLRFARRAARRLIGDLDDSTVPSL